MPDPEGITAKNVEGNGEWGVLVRMFFWCGLQERARDNVHEKKNKKKGDGGKKKLLRQGTQLSDSDRKSRRGQQGGVGGVGKRWGWGKKRRGKKKEIKEGPQPSKIINRAIRSEGDWERKEQVAEPFLRVKKSDRSIMPDF